MGVGAYPMIAAYENQLLEFAVEHPEEWEQLTGKLCWCIPPRPCIQPRADCADERRSCDRRDDGPADTAAGLTRHGFSPAWPAQLNTAVLCRWRA